MPLAYLAGKKGFYKHEFLVERGVLIPRPETELVVEVALQRANEKTVRNLADFGCGSGCIGLSLLRELPEATLWSIDSSVKACGLTAKNAVNLGVDERVFVHNKNVSDWKPKQALDLIVANPPYIAIGDVRVQSHVHQYEPHDALYSGVDGLDAVREWTGKAFAWLNKAGIFVSEIGAGQSTRVVEIMKDAGFEQIEVARDLAGIERVISGVKPNG